MLRFNFSAFNDALETLERNFENYCHIQLIYAPEAYPELFPEPARQRICSQPTINDKLNALFLHTDRHGVPLYILIDEYNNFANTILAHQGPDAYHAFTHGGGFYRNFFATLKAGTENGSVERLFVTGVSPVTMDDVTSGFNIGSNLSLRPKSTSARPHRGRGAAPGADIVLAPLSERYPDMRHGFVIELKYVRRAPKAEAQAQAAQAAAQLRRYLADGRLA